MVTFLRRKRNGNIYKNCISFNVRQSLLKACKWVLRNSNRDAVSL